ncbi:hypothetical protein GCM10027271_42530 [Saccharopolyspora gloriosae]|uniref:Uncharacterized protein n=1 Tax=Saccharopolyspora gloriosae TaxID=455344 RepID=A0A840NHE4_9PSEU|nr:hypothetical protein [Saccharopolyspora gloriosae]MBB5070451.1 hypothetical protein [Saccharopolyspora gloriosae]
MPENTYAIHGLRAGTGHGYSLEATAVRLADAITELRADDGLPAHINTRIEINPQQRELVLRVWGLSVEADPDRTQIRYVMLTLFELASFHNIVPLDTTAPLFTLKILLIDHCERPVAGLVGSGVGDVERLPAGGPWDTHPAGARD